MRRQSIANYLPWLVAVFFYLVEWVQRVIPTLLAVPMAQHYGLSAADLGFIFSIYYYVYAIAQLPAGGLIDRFGPRMVLLWAAALMVVGTLIFIETSHTISLMCGRVLIGLGSSVAFLSCLKVARDSFSQRQFPLVVSATSSIGLLGALLGMSPLSEVGAHWGWQAMLWATIVLSAISVLLIVMVIDRYRGKTCKPGIIMPLYQRMRPVLAIKPLWLIGLYAGLMQVPIIAYAEVWAVPFLHHHDHITLLEAATVNKYIFWGILFGGPCWGYCIPRIKHAWPVLLTCHLAASASLLALLCCSFSVGVLESLSFAVGFFTAIMLFGYAWASQSVAEGLAASAISLVNMLGIIVAASVELGISEILHNLSVSNKQTAAMQPVWICSICAIGLLLLLKKKRVLNQ